jgi:antitoxin ParD1/3/4
MLGMLFGGSRIHPTSIRRNKVFSFRLGKCCQVSDNTFMATQNVSLSAKQSKFIRRRVRGGDYRNASEVVRAGLRLLEQHEEEDKLKLRALRRVAKEAFREIDRGEFEIVEPQKLDKFMKRLEAKARQSKS